MGNTLSVPPPETGHVYLLHNRASGKSYVGQTFRSPEKRWREHKNDALKTDSRYPLHLAIRKYGWDSFDAFVLWSGPATDTNDIERHLIRGFGALSPFGYNLREGGTEGRGVSDETRQKLSDVRKELWKDQRYRNQRKIVMSSPEYRNSQAEVLRKIWSDPELRQRAAEGSKRNWENPEIKEKILKGMREVCSNPEYRKTLSKAQKSAWDNEQIREKRMKGIEKMWDNPSFKEVSINRLQKSLDTPEMKELRSQNTLTLWTSAEYRHNAVTSMKKAAEAPKEKKRKSSASKKIWENPARQAAHKETMKIRWADPEFRAKMAAAQRRRGDKK
jgi:group I intron endonuclease